MKLRTSAGVLMVSGSTVPVAMSAFPAILSVPADAQWQGAAETLVRCPKRTVPERQVQAPTAEQLGGSMPSLQSRRAGLPAWVDIEVFALNIEMVLASVERKPAAKLCQCLGHTLRHGLFYGHFFGLGRKAE
jgi:hypothetical protein